MKKFNLGYYSHSLHKNGTDAEKLEYEFIKSCFHGFTICPNNHMGHIGVLTNYLDIVSNVDVVFTSELNGFVGMGSFNECYRALSKGKPVFVIRYDKSEFQLFELLSLDRIFSNDLNRYAKLKTKKYSPKQFEPFKKP